MEQLSAIVLMMTQPASFPVCVIGSEFMVPYPIEVRVLTNSSGDHLITDVNQNIMLKVKPCNTECHQQRMLLLDVNDRPIVLLREKIMSAYSRWNVVRGDSKADSDMIFSTRTTRMIQSKTNVQVFLANKNGSKDACDFKITGSWSKRNCAIYVGDSLTAIAQMHKNEPGVRFIKDKFMMAINPNVDYAFIVTLIAIVEAMKSSDDEDVGEVIGEIIGASFSLGV